MYTIYLTRTNDHYGYKYLAEWEITENGYTNGYTSRFPSMKEVHEYFDHWGAVEYITK